MADRLSSEQLKELIALGEKAAPPPWSWEDGPPTLYSGRGPNRHGMNLLGRLDLDWNGKNNLTFICASANAASDLAAEVIALRAEVADLKSKQEQLVTALRGGEQLSRRRHADEVLPQSRPLPVDPMLRRSAH